MTGLWLDRILVATDLSPTSEAALTAVRPLAEGLEGTLTLLHVHAPADLAQPGSSVQRGFGAHIQAQLDEMRLRLLGQDARARTSIIASSVVWRAICDYARDHEYGLIAICARGSTDAAGTLLGTVAERVVRAAPCAVLCVQPPPQRALAVRRVST